MSGYGQSRIGEQWRGYYITAYGIAVKHGFEGTEQEWLTSLKGEPGAAAQMRYNEDTQTLQWKLTEDEDWTDLLTLADLQGDVVEQTLEEAEAAKDAAEAAQEAAENAAESAQADASTASSAAASAQSASSAAQAAASGANTSAVSAAESASTAAGHASTSGTNATQAAGSAADARSAKQDAQSAASQASGAASSAEEKAEAAQTASETASTAAQTASESASAAEGYAESAQSAAEDAQTYKEAAETYAQTAASAVSDAQTASTEAQTAASEASESAQDAAESAAAVAGQVTAAESWAVGHTGTREGEDTNNAKYWCEAASQAAGGGVTSFNGRGGAVSPQSGDYTAAMVGADAAGSAAAVQQNLNTHAAGTGHITSAERTTWNAKQNALNFDTEPTTDSTNPVTSGGVKTALNAKANSASLAAHTGNTSNPHNVTAEQTGADPEGTADSAVAAHNAAADAHADIRLALEGKETSGAAAAVQQNLNTHTGNTGIHVTASDKTTWNGKSGKAESFSVTLSASGWSGYAQTVNNAKFIATGYAYTVAPDGESFAACAEAVIYADDITTTGRMTFHCGQVPTDALTMNILRTEANEQ